MTQTQTMPAEPDQARTEALADRLVEMTNGAAIALMTSVGHRTGLFDVMARLNKPVTSIQLAQAAELNERYVREWLGCMTAAQIVETDPATHTYHLPPEHAAVLTRAASPNNIAGTMQWLAVLGGVEDKVVDAFKHGKGVPYAAFNRFHDVMAEESDQTTVAALLNDILPLAGELTQRLESGIDVLEIGCGRAHALELLARTFPNSRFTGLELSPEPIGDMSQRAQRDGITNLDFVFQDAATLDADQQFDLVLAFDAIHDQRDPAAVLAAIHRALRPGGTFLMQDIKAHTCHHDNIGHPMGAFAYAISTFHCMSVSLAQGGVGLGAAWGKEKALEMLGEAGFEDVQIHELDHDILNYYYVMQKN